LICFGRFAGSIGFVRRLFSNLPIDELFFELAQQSSKASSMFVPSFDSSPMGIEEQPAQAGCS